MNIQFLPCVGPPTQLIISTDAGRVTKLKPVQCRAATSRVELAQGLVLRVDSSL